MITIYRFVPQFNIVDLKSPIVRRMSLTTFPTFFYTWQLSSSEVQVGGDLAFVSYPVDTIIDNTVLVFIFQVTIYD